MTESRFRTEPALQRCRDNLRQSLAATSQWPALRALCVGLFLSIVQPFKVIQLTAAEDVPAAAAPVAVAPVAAPAGQAVPPGQPASNPPAAQPGQPAVTPAATPVTVTTIDDKEYKAAQLELQDGKLAVKSEPPQTVPLNELQRVAITHETKLAVEWIGQATEDRVQVGSVNEGNGMADAKIRLSGLAAKGLKQVVILSRPQFRAWRLDPSKSPAWRIAAERIGQASIADLYFEPPAKDLFETELEVTVTFQDDTSAKANVKAASHTSDSTKVETPAAGTAVRLASIQLDGGDSLQGHLLPEQDDQLLIRTSWSPSFAVPLAQVRGLAFDSIKPELKTKYEERLAKPTDDDLVIVQSKDGGFTDVEGRLQSVGQNAIKILYQQQERSIKLDRVQAIVLGARPNSVSWKGPYQSFKLASGDQVSAQWQSIAEKTFNVKSSWGESLELPREAVIEVTGRNTKMVNLSDLTPATVEQLPYFDRVMPWAKDKSLTNKPLRLDDRTYLRGLAVHSRCFLTYDIGGEFATFRAVLGFDEDAGTRGRVVCRVLVDNRELFAKPDLKAGEKAVPIEISVKGAKQLRLEVDFGEDEDVGDRVIWANARLFRE